MRAGALVALLALAGLAAHAYAQSGASSRAVRVTQTAYLKASNPDADDHFGAVVCSRGTRGRESRSAMTAPHSPPAHRTKPAPPRVSHSNGLRIETVGRVVGGNGHLA